MRCCWATTINFECKKKAVHNWAIWEASDLYTDIEKATEQSSITRNLRDWTVQRPHYPSQHWTGCAVYIHLQAFASLLIAGFLASDAFGELDVDLRLYFGEFGMQVFVDEHIMTDNHCAECVSFAMNKSASVWYRSNEGCFHLCPCIQIRSSVLHNQDPL